MKNILNWIKHDWFGLIADIFVLVFCFINKLDLYTILLIIYVIVSTILHYERYCNYKDKEDE